MNYLDSITLAKTLPCLAEPGKLIVIGTPSQNLGEASIDVWETTGGNFDAPGAAINTNVGTMNIEFADCSHATLSYSLTDDDVEGAVDIDRVVPGTEALCEQLDAAR